MQPTLPQSLLSDPDGLLTYEYIANNIGTVEPELPALIANIVRVDSNGQFCVSAARYLHAIDAERFSGAVDTLIEAAIDRDRDRAYIALLLPDIWGADYESRAEELQQSSRNFRRIYRRIYPTGI
ncbi:MAG: hypothetical protein J6C77_03075 [Muribaculaceae bacterium]|nr:hypothetical protein [Muribaculaceae bacterium]